MPQSTRFAAANPSFWRTRRPFDFAQESRALAFLRLQKFDRVAQFRCAFVELLGNSGFHFALHDLQLRERPFRFHFFQPFLEKRDLGPMLSVE